MHLRTTRATYSAQIETHQEAVEDQQTHTVGEGKIFLAYLTEAADVCLPLSLTEVSNFRLLWAMLAVTANDLGFTGGFMLLF